MESMFERLVSDFAYLRKINSCNTNRHLNLSAYIVSFHAYFVNFLPTKSAFLFTSLG